MSTKYGEYKTEVSVDPEAIATTGTAIYTIPEANFSKLAEKIDQLNKRARRLSIPEITVESTYSHRDFLVQDMDVLPGEVQNATWVRETEVDQFIAGRMEKRGETWQRTSQTRNWLTVTVTGSAPNLDGWQFVATLEPVEVEVDGENSDDSNGKKKAKIENIIQSVPGAEKLPEVYRHRIGECDHCKQFRRRNQTFVVKHGSTGELKMIGRNCIKDFLGHANPHQLAAWAQLLVDLDAACRSEESFDEDDFMGGGGGGGRDCAFDMRDYLAFVVAVVEDRGFVSRSKVRESMTPEGECGLRATADVAWYLIAPPPSGNYKATQDWREARAKFTATDKQRDFVENAIEWARGLDDDRVNNASSDYLANLRTVGRMASVGAKTCGIAASMIPAYAREIGAVLFEKEKIDRKNELFGTVKTRSEFVVLCEKVTPNDGYYGTTGIHKLVGIEGGEKVGKGKAATFETGGVGDVTGKSLVWFASEKTEWLKEGGKYRVKATVKSHGEFRGWKQTVLTRVEVLERIGEEDGEGEDRGDSPAGKEGELVSAAG